jgi:predicted nicotinamide N-methyase
MIHSPDVLPSTPNPPQDWPTFIRANTELMAPPLVPEIRLYLATESMAIWSKTEEELGESNIAPPFWAFAWAGGQALARHLFDHPEMIRGQRVLDLGAGSGMLAIAAMTCGARSVLAADIDPIALAACAANATANNVVLETTSADLLLGALTGFDVILVGDLFYERTLAEKVLCAIESAAAAGARVLIGDPQRNYFPKGRFACAAEYRVPVTRELEDAEIKLTAVWSL